MEFVTDSSKIVCHGSSRISVIIPTWNEENQVVPCIRSVRLALPDAEVVVVDGGSHDRTVPQARGEGVKVIQSARGRGIQMRVGAQMASGGILLFLHADTLLPEGAQVVLKEWFIRREVQIAKFALRFDASHWLLNFYSQFTRWDSLWTTFGDQGLAIRKDFYESLGGFPPWPLFEDVYLLQQARKRTQIHCLPLCVTTSARRFLKEGIVRQQWRNARMILMYLCCVSPQELYAKYKI